MDLHTQNYISLAAGVGGLDLGVHMALRTARLVCAVEIEAYACEVLASRMEEAWLDEAPVWTDLRTFYGRPWRGLVDGIVAGYPCQPFSLAGSRRGVDDPRHLWPHVARVIREVQPSWVFCENVVGHLSLGAREVIGELQEMGFDVASSLFTAEEVGAPHRRERIFILALAHGEQRELQRRGGSGELEEEEGEEQGEGCERQRDGHTTLDRRADVGDAASITERESGDEGLRAHGGSEPIRTSNFVGDADGEGREGWRLRERQRANERPVGRAGRSLAESGSARHLRVVPFPPTPDDVKGWRWYLDTFGEELAPALTRAELLLRRGADGMACRLDELRACGNGVVPLQAAYAFVSLLRDLLAYRRARSGSGRHDVESRSAGVGVAAPELE